jgi:hypothetical protein
MNNLNIIISKFLEFIIHIKEIVANKDILINIENISDNEKLEKIKNFNNSINSETNFNYLLKKKIKLFSHKNPDTLLISESLFGNKLSLKKIFNNQDDTVKLVIWKDLHELLFYYNKYLLENNLNDDKNNIEEKINKLSNIINPIPIKESLSKILNTDNLNDTTNNMINDIFDVFQNSHNIQNGNPLNNIFELSKSISEKYKNNIENGDIKIDDLLKNMSKLPGMESLPDIVDKISSSVINQSKNKETVLIDENYSTANINVGNEESNILSSMNVGSLLNTMDSLGMNPLNNLENVNEGFNLNSMMNLLNNNTDIKNLINSLNNNNSNENIDINEITKMFKK